ncbi:hypothetical protein NDA11_003625 [Ustilago hordei]|nr:hypothetical protein NDA10_000008 [Ustilago hordei]KAJ1570766.1 hypothetical protein NDA11_003625 [Ustilago hordei]UTT96498.1 hypothetical protein NDA17_003580 [Ustilago hordei]
MATASTTYSSSSSSSSSSSAPATPRFDFYQTDTAVTLSIFIKSASTETVSVSINHQSLLVRATCSTNGSEYMLTIDPLFSPVDPSYSSYKVLSTKIEVVLHKVQPGVRWVELQGGARKDVVSCAITPACAASQAAEANRTATPRARSKWDSFDPDADEPENASGATGGSGGEGADEADINKFFQKLYADADQDTKRAMMKSYQESGGTTLSTDWSKVGKKQVQTQPPDGMEAKKWEQ